MIMNFDWKLFCFIHIFIPIYKSIEVLIEKTSCKRKCGTDSREETYTKEGEE